MTSEHNLKDLHMHTESAHGIISPRPTIPVSSSLSSSVSSPFPNDAKLINLREGSKAPASPHGHHDAVPQAEFVQTGTNVGIVLDGMFVLVDIDHPDNDEARALSARCLEAAPRVHQTPRGRHFLFRTQPEWSGTNSTLRDKNGTVFGDIKALGYAVGPGSNVNGADYSVVAAVDPPLAPQWLLEMAVKPVRAEQTVEERTGIPYGEHDHFLVRLAGYLRGREGLTEDAIRGVLEAGPLGVLDSYDETRPYTDRDLARIAHSVARKSAAYGDDFSTSPPGLLLGSDVALIKPPIEWIVRGFIPCGELVLMYGPGGIGKSTMGSWLNAEVTMRRKNFGFVGTEETPERFLGRSRLAGADLSRTWVIENPAKLKFPRDSKLLHDLILQGKLDCLYLDSIYSHFEVREGQNAAEKARDSLAPLLAIAHATGCTIFGVFHTNKAGSFLGSTEMENVARCLLEAKRKPKQTYLGVRVKKTNLYNPGMMMRLVGHEMDFVDANGEPQLEYDDDGELQPWKIIVPKRDTDVVDNPDDDEDAPIEYEQSEVKDFRVTNKQRIKEYMRDHPGAGATEISEVLNIPMGTAKRCVYEVNNDA